MNINLELDNQPLQGESLLVPGRDFALCALPLNFLCSTTSATINDTTTVINSQDVQREVLRLCSYKKNREIRSAPTMLDKYSYYNDAFGTLNNPNAGYDGATDYDNVPNGAYNNLQFTAPNGTVLGTSATLHNPAWIGTGGIVAPYASVNGIPVGAEQWSNTFVYLSGHIVQYGSSVWKALAPVVGTPPDLVAPTEWQEIGQNTAYELYIAWRSTEPIILSPFVFSDEYEWDTGLFGISNIQLIMNLRSDISRVIRSTTRAGREIVSAGFSQGVANAFVDSVVNVQFLTPSLNIGACIA
jgi:hypothetical protein